MLYRSFANSLLPLILVWPTCGQAQEVYRTVDEQGNTLFTNDPAMAGQGEVVPLPPLPGEQQIEEALEREDRLRSIGDKMQQDRTKRESQLAEIAAQQRKELAEAERDREILERLDRLSRPGAYFYPPIHHRPPRPVAPPPVQLPWPPKSSTSPGLKPAP